MHELTPLEQELVDYLVAFWADPANTLPLEFYQKLMEISRQRKDKASVHRLLTDEVTILRSPKCASQFREQFPNEEAYRSSLVADIVSLLPSAQPPTSLQELSTDRAQVAELVILSPNVEPIIAPESLENCDVLAELAEYWDTGKKSKDLVAHIQGFVGPAALKDFMLRVFERVSRLGRSAYSIEFLGYQDNQTGFCQYLLRDVTRAAMEREREEAKRAAIKREEEAKEKARADFEALGKRMSVATSHEELVALGRQRAEIAPLTGHQFTYRNHCWKCKERISSEVNAQCPVCKFYICSDSECGECLCGFPGRRS